MNTQQESPEAENGEAHFPTEPDQAPDRGKAYVEIIPANLRALEPVYVAAMLEEARVFEAVDRLVEMFSLGMLPLSSGRAGALLYRYWKGHHHRLTPAQRHRVYARAFGLGDEVNEAGLVANRKFTDLWLGFVSIVGMYSAELQVLPPAERSVGPEEVLVGGRLLAMNLSSFGQGVPWFAAQDFRSELQQVFELLSDAEIQTAFESKDAWEVVQKVGRSGFGTRPNVTRGHTRGETGVIIIRWLANRRARLLRPRSANILRHEDICEGRTAASRGKKATMYPTDADLVMACERWLAVTGTEEAQIRETPTPVAEPASVESVPLETVPLEPTFVPQDEPGPQLA